MIEDKVSEKNFKYIVENIRSEGEEIDFKECFKFEETRDKLEVTKDIVSFANTKGGYILYGVKEDNGQFIFSGLDDRSSRIDHVDMQNYISNYTDDIVHFSVAIHEYKNEIFYLLYVEKYEGQDLVSFKKDGGYVKNSLRGGAKNDFVFRKHQAYGRKGCANAIVNHDKQFKKIRNSETSIISNINSVESPFEKYVQREDILKEFLDVLNKNIPCIQINGLGGIGKTSFVYNFCTQLIDGSIENCTFHPKYIIWITGKLTLFRPTGDIQKIKKSEITYEEFIDEMESVLGVDLDYSNNEKSNNIINDSLEMYPSLLVVDNMETITDKNILEFLSHVPRNSKVILTTRENMEKLTYRRINLSGFSQQQFQEYYNNQFSIFDPKNEISSDLRKKYENDIFEKTQGSPIITNMMIYKICNGSNIDVLLDNFNLIDDTDSYYDKAMEFCFKDTFNTLTKRDKEVMYILSTADSSDVGFEINDIAYILDNSYTLNALNDSIMKLHQLSFCNKKENSYISPNLVKIFANRELSNSANIDTDAIGDKLKLFYKKKEYYQNKTNSYYEHARAFTFDEKEIAEQVKEIIDEYETNGDYDVFEEKFNILIERQPKYSYPYFKRALLEKNINSDIEIIRKYFDKAVECDAQEDHYWTEYAFFEESRGNRDLASRYFDNALKINHNNVSAHHGYAVCLKKYYNQKPEYFSSSKIILEHFEKAYFKETKRYEINHNAKNAHAHASYLMTLERNQEALEVCEKGLKYQKYNQALSSLWGSIMKKIDPEFVGESRINNMKKGIFSSLSNQDVKKLVKMVEGVNKK